VIECNSMKYWEHNGGSTGISRGFRCVPVNASDEGDVWKINADMLSAKCDIISFLSSR
jgi:hypothetical protein